MIAVAATGALIGLGVWMIVLAIVPHQVPIARTVARLHRTEPFDIGHSSPQGIGGWLVEHVGRERLVGTRHADLAVLDRTPEQHGAQLAFAIVTAAIAPAVLAGVLTILGVSVGVLVPLWCCPIAGGLAGLLVVARLTERARVERSSLRLQLGAYLDVLAMLLSAGEADEQALQLAATAGDARLFRELQRVYRDAARNGTPMLSGMARLGERWALAELVEIAAAGSLAASDGAAVRRTLMTKARAMRTTQLSDEETDARLRTNKLAFPQILLACGFLVLVLYPAFVGLVDGITTTR